MVTINNEELREVYYQLATLDNVLQKEVRQVEGNKTYLDKIVPEQISKTYSKNLKTALSFVNDVKKVAYESAVVYLIATFERIVFAKYNTAYGIAKSAVRDTAPTSMDYYKVRENLVGKNAYYLADIIKLIDGHFPTELIKTLKILKDHRNYIAHGKRETAAPTIEMKLSDIAKTLDDIIREIES